MVEGWGWAGVGKHLPSGRQFQTYFASLAMWKYREAKRENLKRQTPNRPQPTEGRTLTFPLIIPEASLPFKRFS